MAVPTPAYAAAGTGSRTVLFLHGIGGNRASFAEQMGRIPGWRTLAWDMPGYGASPPIAPLSFAALAEAVVAVLDAEGCEAAVLVGHSLGGMIALETAARFPGRVSGLVLFATSSAFGGRDDSFKKEFLAQRLAPLDRAIGDFLDSLT
ncbi:MAG: alpha/beta hydrolase [Rhodospirillaceae bacterium]|nr:alpha/beta hydrolase [Rhodospirillaceae bacterium]